MLVKNQLDLIGKTPLLLLNKLSMRYNCNIYLKLEKYNLTHSSKDRAVKEIIINALKDNKINKDSTIIEATSGNTGISLACICAILSLKCIIIMPNKVSEERKKIIESYGAKTIYIDGKMKECLKKVNQLKRKIKNHFVLSQFDNINNINAHYKYTSKEIIDDLSIIDGFFASYGTGGSISGISKLLKAYNNQIKCVCVIPDNKSHKIEGIYSNIKPKNYIDTYIDETIKISDVKAYEMQKYLTINEGVFLGYSSSLAVSGALKYIKKNKLKNIVIFCPDGGERYLSNKYLIEKQKDKEEIIKDIEYMYQALFKNEYKDEVWFKYHISINNVKKIYKQLLLDAKAIYDNDPSCNSIYQVIESYVSFYAIFAYRIAHFIYKYYDKRIARIISEYAHSKTAIDIHPSAKIGTSFCIDHGCGIVIGQTCIIGNNVKLYHGVTLGALSLKNARKLVNKKRHPTIKDNVIIYCNASIFGGNTIIGNNCIIGANQIIVSSIKDNSIVKEKK